MWFYKESYWYNWKFQGLGGSTAKNTGTNGDFRVYVVLQKIRLVQIEYPGSMLFYKNYTSTNRDLRFLDSVDIFKSKLKTHLFGLAYHDFL